MANHKNMSRDVERDLNKLVNERMKSVSSDIDKALRVVNNTMYEEATKMFDSFITQYYTYKTLSYIRHWEGVPGTGKGQNLYFGKNIIKNAKKISLSIDIDTFGENGMMADDYEYDSAHDVLRNVMEGHRGVPNKWNKDWTGSYEGKYFSYAGTMIDAFNLLNNNFESISENIFYEIWGNMGY